MKSSYNVALTGIVFAWVMSHCRNTLVTSKRSLETRAEEILKDTPLIGKIFLIIL